MIYLNTNFFLNFVLLFFLFILKNNDAFVFSYVIIPFYYEKEIKINTSKSILSPKEYYEQKLNALAYTDLKINNIYIKFHLTFDRYASYISEKDFNETINDEYNEKANIYSLDYIGIPYAKYHTNKLFFMINGTNEKLFNNYSIFTVKNMKSYSDYQIDRYAYATQKNEIGLNIIKGNKYNPVEVGGYDPYSDPDYFSQYKEINNINIRKLDTIYILKNGGYEIEDRTNLINQLKSQEFISSYAFTFKFDSKNDNNGTIIIGGYPHDIDPKHYQEKYFIYDKIDIKYLYYYWCYTFKDIAYGNNKLEWAKNFEFSFEFPFILSTWNYWKYLDQQFFENENYKKFCYQEKIGEYYIKYCQKEVIKYFKNLYFYLSNTYLSENQTDYIEFNYTDLFIKSDFDDNIYLFQIIFVDNSYKWIFGKPLFKKYTTVFDQEKKIIGFYTQTGEYKLDDNEKDKTDILFFIILGCFIVLFSLLLILGIIFFCKFPFNKRKIKANELDDDYDYTSNKDNNQSNLMIN